MRSPPSDSALLPADQLRVDAVRGFLPAHCPRLCLRVREEVSAVSRLVGLGCSGLSYPGIWSDEGLPRRRDGHDSVSGTTIKLPLCRINRRRNVFPSPTQMLDERDRLHEHPRSARSHLDDPESPVPLQHYTSRAPQTKSTRRSSGLCSVEEHFTGFQVSGRKRVSVSVSEC